MQSGYTNLHPEARAVAELTELLVRHDLLKIIEARAIPGYKPPGELIKEINQRFSGLSETAKAAVVDLRCGGKAGKTWQAWLRRHLAEHPGDSADLLLLQQDFGASAAGRDGGAIVSWHIVENYGLFNRPWRMEHRW